MSSSTRDNSPGSGGPAGLLRRFHRDRRGTSMTEFVITLPIVLLIFVGIIELTQYGRAATRARIEAHHETFDAIYEVQRTPTNGVGVFDVVDQAYFDPGTLPHRHPTSAAIKSEADLMPQAYPPYQPTQFARGLVTAAETTTYGEMAATGHFGESHGRLMPALLVPNSGLPGVEQAMAPHPQKLFGSGNTRSWFARDLMYDGIDVAFDFDDCQSALGVVVSGINQGIGATGIRPMLSGGIRYGTVVGEVDTTIDMGSIGPIQARAYYTSLAPPHVFEGDPGLQPAITTIFTRLAMMNCAIQPYNGLLGIGDDPKLPVWSDAVLDVPTPDGDTEFSYPLDYHDTVRTEKP